VLSSPAVTLYVDDLQGQREFCELEERLLADIVRLDFQKAFDKNPHEKLLNKLDFHGVGGKSFHGLKSDYRIRSKRRAKLSLFRVEKGQQQCLSGAGCETGFIQHLQQ